MLKIKREEKAKGSKCQEKAEEKLREAEGKAKKAQEKAKAQAEQSHALVSNSRQHASIRALYSGPATAGEGAITARRVRISDSATDVSRKASNPSTSVMDKVTNEEINPNVCCMCL